MTFRWMLVFPDRRPMEIFSSPELSADEVRRRYPDATPHPLPESARDSIKPAREFIERWERQQAASAP